MFKRKKLPRWSRVSDYVFRKKEPNKIMAIVEIDVDQYVCIHTDINFYDFAKKTMYKGDLV